MTIHVARDYPSATSGYFNGGVGYFYTPFLYNLAVFLHKVLGYSVVGNTGFNINNTNSQTFTNAANTAIAAASNGQTLPQSTINVASTTGFPASGTAYVATNNGIQIVRYSGTTATTLTNCTGGTGTMTAGLTTTTSGIQTLPTATINVTGNPVSLGFPTSGTIYVITTAGPQIVNYTNITTSSFTGCTGGTGTTAAGNSVASAGGVVACGLNRILTATGGPPTITTTFPHGMSTGDYAQIAGAGTLNNGIVPAHPVTVVDSFTLTIPSLVSAGAYVTNSQNLQPAGMLIASGTAQAGTGASINFAGAPSTSAVQVPTTVRTVVNGTAPTTGDSSRMLVLKSNLYPTKNSGIFKITAVNTATNSYTVDYRATDTPISENGTLDWWLYEVETQACNYMQLPDTSRFSGVGITAASNTTPIQITFNPNTYCGFATGQKVTISGVGGNTNANGTWTITFVNSTNILLNASSGNGAYTSGGTISRAGYTGGESLSYNSKIILQSPHASGWQTRIAVEQFNNPNTIAYTSITVGSGGTAQGDWVAGGVTTHTGAFFDINIPLGSPYVNTVTGSANASNAPRVTIVGDDGGQAVFCYCKNQTGGSNGLLLMGVPDNEPSPAPVNSNRMFAYSGCTAQSSDYGGIQMRGGTSFNTGFTYRDTQPEMCMISGWANMDGVSGTSPVYSANAGDCPFTGTTEVLPWEIWAGVLNDPALGLPTGSNGLPIYYSFNQRFMGTAPFLRQGRTNFGTFTLSTDNTAAFTVTNATNTSPIQITTSAANALATGQTVVISGVTGNTAANGTFVITVIDNQHFTLNNSTGNANYISGGTGNGTAHWLHLQNGIYLQWNGASGSF